MTNMRILIRIVFVIFIANGIDCLGRVCDDCCDCFKEEIKEDENKEIAISLVNDYWYKAQKNNLVLKIFVKEENGIFKDNGNKVSFKLEGNNNPKIAYQNKKKDPLNLEGKKYALFRIKTKGKNTVYLYCSDVESSGKDNDFNGIFENMDHISISVIACDTEKVENMAWMLNKCNSLTELNLQNFNTKNVTNMKVMFGNCSSLENLNLNNFNTEKVTDMGSMFFKCSELKELNLESFNTKKVENIRGMFQGCKSLKKINFGNNFNTEKVTKKKYMFSGCNSFPEDIQNKSVEGIIDFFKKDN